MKCTHACTHTRICISLLLFIKEFRKKTKGATLSWKMGNNHTSVLAYQFYEFSFTSDYDPYLSGTGFGIRRGQRLLSSHLNLEKVIIYVCKWLKYMFWRWDRVGEVNVTEGGQIYVWKETPVYIFRMRESWWTEVNSASQRFHVYCLKRSGIKVCMKKMSNTDPLSSLWKRKWWELPVHEVTREVPCPAPGMCGILDNCSIS